jgi:hypothetical protein
VPGKGYFTIFRLYSPTKAAINKSWKPGPLLKLEAYENQLLLVLHFLWNRLGDVRSRVSARGR